MLPLQTLRVIHHSVYAYRGATRKSLNSNPDDPHSSGHRIRPWKFLKWFFRDFRGIITIGPPLCGLSARLLRKFLIVFQIV
jgi:hypothetical protein